MLRKIINIKRRLSSFLTLKVSEDVKPQVISKKTYLEKIKEIDEDMPEVKVIKEAKDGEAEVVQLVIEPRKIICPDCGGLTLDGLEFCHKCGGEIDINM